LKRKEDDKKATAVAEKRQSQLDSQREQAARHKEQAWLKEHGQRAVTLHSEAIKQQAEKEVCVLYWNWNR